MRRPGQMRMSGGKLLPVQEKEAAPRVPDRNMKKRKIFEGAFLAAACAAMLCFPGYASSDDDDDDPIKISQVTIYMDLDQPEAGSDVEEDLTDAFSVPDDAHYVISDAEYVNDTDSEWANGVTPTIDVTLEPESDDYEFKGGLKVHFSSSTDTDSVKLKSRKDEEAVVRIKLNDVRGAIDEPEQAGWADTFTASWEAVDGAKSYKVKLYYNDDELVTVSTTALHYDFTNSMTKAGTYSFEVKACAEKSADDSGWSEESDKETVTAEEIAAHAAAAGTGNASDTGTSSDSETSSGTASESTRTVIRQDTVSGDGWQEENGRWICRVGGEKVQNAWLLDTDGSWYYMDDSGYMKTGWFEDSDGLWYYLRESASGDFPEGSMKTGWYLDQGNWYYLSDGSDGYPAGSMAVGNRMIDGQRYTFAESGRLYGTRDTD